MFQEEQAPTPRCNHVSLQDGSRSSQKCARDLRNPSHEPWSKLQRCMFFQALTRTRYLGLNPGAVLVVGGAAGGLAEEVLGDQGHGLHSLLADE